MTALLILFTLATFYLLILLGRSYQRENNMRTAIETVCLHKLDDLCWIDFYDLAAAAECKMPDLTLLPKEVMLQNCARYVDCLMQSPENRAQATERYRACTDDPENQC